MNASRVMHQRISIGVAAATVLASLLVALPAQAAPSGTVGATVTVAGPTGACLTVDTTQVGFGTLNFSTSTAVTTGLSTPMYAVANCGDAAIDVNVRGTDATGDGGASWTLNGSNTIDCAVLDSFAADATFTGANGATLATTDRPFGSLAPAGSITDIDHQLAMPCEGSSGVGQTMTFDIIYTAIAAA